MNLSAKTEYACIAMLELAADYGSGQPVRIGQIAEKHGIPARFLVQILLQLKGTGLVASVRGAAGGYQMIRPPEEVTLGEVMAMMEGQLGEVKGSAGRETPVSRALLAVWNEAATAQRQLLQSVTFADLVEGVRDEAANMYYI